MPSKIRMLALCYLCLSLASTLTAAESWTLRLKLEPGATQSYEMTQSQKMLISSDAGEQEVTSLSRNNFDQTVKEVREDGSIVFETVYRRLRTKMNTGGQTFSIDSDKPDERDGLAAKSQGFLIDKPFTTVVSRRGEILEVDGVDRYLDEMLESLGSNPRLHQMMQGFRAGMSGDAIKSLLQQASAVLPEQPVKLGDLWSATVEVSNPGMGQMTIALDYDARSIGTRRERNSLEVGVKARFEFKSPDAGLAPMAEMMGADAEVKVVASSGEGSYWIDVENGQVVESELNLSFETEVGLTIRASGESMKMKSTIEQQIGLGLQ